MLAYIDAGSGSIIASAVVAGAAGAAAAAKVGWSKLGGKRRKQAAEQEAIVESELESESASAPNAPPLRGDERAL